MMRWTWGRLLLVGAGARPVARSMGKLPAAWDDSHRGAISFEIVEMDAVPRPCAANRGRSGLAFYRSSIGTGARRQSRRAPKRRVVFPRDVDTQFVVAPPRAAANHESACFS